MQFSHFFTSLKPNSTSLGYALFIAVNAAGVWGGVFPFLPMSFQTNEITFWFFLAQSLVFSFSYFISVLGVYFFPKSTRRFLVLASAIPYFIGWCLLIAATYVPTRAILLVIIGGGVLGLGTAGFFMLWQRLFAGEESDTGNHDLILGTAYGALLYCFLYSIPLAVTVFLIPLVFLPLFSLAIILRSRTIDLGQPMFEEEPRSHPHVYHQLLHDYWRSAFCIGALGFCSGTMRSLVIVSPEFGSYVNIMSMAGSLLLSLGLLLVWQSKSLRINIATAYRVFFPFIITGFAALPFLDRTFATVFSCLIYAAYNCAALLMMIQCAQASRDRGINPVFIYGFLGGIVYLINDIGFLTGTFAENLGVISMNPLVAVAFLAIYLLGLMYFIGQGGFRKVLSLRRESAESIELVALSLPTSKWIGPAEETYIPKKDDLSESVGSTKKESIDESPQYRDRLSKQCALLQQHFRLSARETEVMESIARGNSVVKIAEELVVSENTIRTHSKRIYTKLDVHKKQELLDLIESAHPKKD